jgi:predicted peptidase
MTKEKDVNSGLAYYVRPAKTAGMPLIIFLHGTGERGTNLDLVLRYGPLAILKAGKSIRFDDATVVQPQLLRSQSKWNIGQLKKLKAHLIEKYAPDTTRIHGMGVSLGGYGLWEWLADEDGKSFATATLMSPGVGPRGKEAIIAAFGVPIWIAHAKNDPLSAAKFVTSYNAAQKINQLAGRAQVQITSYGLTGHSTGGAWGRFMEPDNYFLWDWMKVQSVDLPTMIVRLARQYAHAPKFGKAVKRIKTKAAKAAKVVKAKVKGLAE